MEKTRIDVSAFQDGDDYIVVFHNCRPELKAIIDGMLNPVKAPDSYAEYEPTPEAQIPDYRAAEYYGELAKEAEAEEAAMEAVEDMISSAAEPEAAPEVPTLGPSFGQFSEEPAVTDNILSILQDSDENFGILMEGRKGCADAGVRQIVSTSIVSFLRHTFRDADPGSPDTSMKLNAYAAAIPSRIIQETGYPTVAMLFERGTEEEKKIFAGKCLSLFGGTN